MLTEFLLPGPWASSFLLLLNLYNGKASGNFLIGLCEELTRGHRSDREEHGAQSECSVRRLPGKAAPPALLPAAPLQSQGRTFMVTSPGTERGELDLKGLGALRWQRLMLGMWH